MQRKQLVLVWSAASNFWVVNHETYSAGAELPAVYEAFKDETMEACLEYMRTNSLSQQAVPVAIQMVE